MLTSKSPNPNEIESPQDNNLSPSKSSIHEEPLSPSKTALAQQRLRKLLPKPRKMGAQRGSNSNQTSFASLNMAKRTSDTKFCDSTASIMIKAHLRHVLMAKKTRPFSLHAPYPLTVLSNSASAISDCQAASKKANDSSASPATSVQSIDPVAQVDISSRLFYQLQDPAIQNHFNTSTPGEILERSLDSCLIMDAMVNEQKSTSIKVIQRLHQIIQDNGVELDDESKEMLSLLK